MFKSFWVATAAVAVLAASPALAAERICKGVADGKNGESVQVDVAVDDSGAVVSREATWWPAGAGDEDPRGAVIFGAPLLSFTYDASDPARVGALNEGVLFIMVTSGGGEAVRKSEIRLDIDGKRVAGGPPPTVAARTDDKGAETVGMGILSVPASSLGALATASRAHAETRLADGRTFFSDFDLGDRSVRDKLYVQAWTKADKAAKKPAKCDAPGA